MIMLLKMAVLRREPPENLEQLHELGIAFALVTASDGTRHTVLDMALEDFLLDAAQGRLHRTQLDKNVTAVALLLRHAHQAGHLAVNAFQAREFGGMARVVHDAYTIPPYGINVNSASPIENP